MTPGQVLRLWIRRSVRLHSFSLKFPPKITRNLHTLRSAMSVVIVRNLEDDENMKICFSYEGKQKNLQRSKMEPLSRSLARIALSTLTSKKKDKKASKTAQPVFSKDEKQPNASLWFGGSLVDQELLNKDAWRDGSVLHISETILKVEVNPPTVLSLTLPSHIMVDFPVFPILEVEFAEIKHCSFSWLRSKNPEDSSASSVPPVLECEWEDIGMDFFYKPSVLDIGCYMKLVCVAGRDHRKSSLRTEVTSSVKVSAAPGHCPFEERHLYTAKKLDQGSLRCVSYNILADAYAREEFALNVLYPYCPPYALDIGYRKQVLMKELTGYNADILCLQECGHRLFESFLNPCLKMLGYQGILKCKAGEVPEGEALFFDENKFELVQSHDIVLHDSLLQDPVQENILDHIASIPGLFENLQKRNSVAQVVILKVKSKEDSYLCVVNTHLYYRPLAPHIRMLQAALIFNHTKKVLSMFKVSEDNSETASTLPAPQEREYKSLSKSHIAVIFCGDFNSTPRSGLFQLYTQGYVEASHYDWIVVEDEDQHCTSLSLSHDFDLLNACGTPAFTNYTSGFKGTLDYIFCDNKYFEIQAVIPLPTEDELCIHVALPSVVMPSDHLALVCDLKWKHP